MTNEKNKKIAQLSSRLRASRDQMDASLRAFVFEVERARQAGDNVHALTAFSVMSSATSTIHAITAERTHMAVAAMVADIKKN